MYSCVFFKIRPKYIQLTKVFIISYKLNVYLMNMTSLLKNPILLCSNSLNKMLHLVQYYLHDKMFPILVWYQLSWKCQLYPNQLYVQLTKVFIISYKLNVYLVNMSLLLKNPILICSSSLNKMLHPVQYYLHDKMFHILVWYQLSWKC